MTERDEEKADAVEVIREALDALEEAGGGFDAWQHHYLLQAFDHLHQGRYGEAITFAEDALTPPQERNAASIPDPVKRATLAELRRDLDHVEAGAMR